jgi:GNAT superfamily N-acetyltransferase
MTGESNRKGRIMTIEYTNSITLEEANKLRVSVGWGEIELEQATIGIKNTAFLICARHEGNAVGMARVITDYGYVVYVADMIVLPEYQGKGIGGEIMSRVMSYINENTLQGQSKYIGLHASKGKEAFYEKFGLTQRPTDNLGCGMTMWFEKK